MFEVVLLLFLVCLLILLADCLVKFFDSLD